MPRRCVVHCYAGISRSTAGAYVAACALNPHRDELAIAQGDAQRLADRDAQPAHRGARGRMLGRSGRMVDAIRTIGTGVPAFAGEPFRIDLE